MKPDKLQKGMVLLWFLHGHVVLTQHSRTLQLLYFRAKEKFITITLAKKSLM